MIQLVEYERRSLPRSDLKEEEAREIHQTFGCKIEVEWPSPKTNDRWQLTSLGWVGFVPFGEGRRISIQPKVPLKNIFGMLEYAYDIRAFEVLNGRYDCETIQGFYERIATILAKCFLDRAKQGLYKTYIEEDACLPYVRGRIDVLAFAVKPVKTTVPCSYEDHSIDIEDNRIIAWTLYTILRSGICSERATPIISKAEKVLKHSVSLWPFSAFDCAGRNYNRLNADYEIIHKLCRFILESTGPTHNRGDRSMLPFLVDMARLFELFVARWLDEKLNNRYRLERQSTHNIDGKGDLRITMDIVIYDRSDSSPLCIIDTKYKAQDKVSNDDYYQAVAYADAIGCENAVLIYPRELKCPFDNKPGNVRVITAVFDVGGDLDKAGNILLKQLDNVLDACSANKQEPD